MLLVISVIYWTLHEKLIRKTSNSLLMNAVGKLSKVKD